MQQFPARLTILLALFAACSAESTAPDRPSVEPWQGAPVVVAADEVLANRIVFLSQPPGGFRDIVTARFDGSHRKSITSGIYTGSVAVSPDGRRIVYWRASNLTRSDTHIMNADGSGDRPLLPGFLFPNQPVAFSPDGQWVSLEVEKPGPFGEYTQMFIVRVTGADLRQVTPDVPPTSYTSDFTGNWSPDGKWMVVSRSGIVFRIRPNGKGITNIHPPGQGQLCTRPAWCPVGNKIACAMLGVPGHTQYSIVTFNADGSGLTSLTNTGDQDNEPRWSPTGTHLLFSRVVGNRLPFQIFRIRADGTHETRISMNANDEYGADWAPIVPR